MGDQTMIRFTAATASVVALTMLMLSGCVWQSDYDKLQAQYEQLQAQNQ
jgi:outer membrane murein-binding lipoprotein Lpp